MSFAYEWLFILSLLFRARSFAAWCDGTEYHLQVKILEEKNNNNNNKTVKTPEQRMRKASTKVRAALLKFSTVDASIFTFRWAQKYLFEYLLLADSVFFLSLSLLRCCLFIFAFRHSIHIYLSLFRLLNVSRTRFVVCPPQKAPQKHAGWQNRTWVARDYKPICPQLKAYTFDEIHNGYAPHAIKTDENCLFLNIWTPQVHTTRTRSPATRQITKTKKKHQRETP